MFLLQPARSTLKPGGVDWRKSNISFAYCNFINILKLTSIQKSLNVTWWQSCAALLMVLIAVSLTLILLLDIDGCSVEDQHSSGMEDLH